MSILMAKLSPINRHWLIIIPIALITAFSIWGIKFVPFHPDESTQLFTSSDYYLLIHNPTLMVWNSELEADQRQIYRELDAPLTRYILGFSRSLFNIPALPVDWDWSKSWQQNQQAGALPSQEMLFVGRLGVTLLLPFSLLLIYTTGKAIGNRFTGLLALLLMGSNALILLHTRRAMAEGALVFGITFSAWSFVHGDRRPWVAGIAVALAVAAKQSALALLPAGILAVSWAQTSQYHWFRKSIFNLVQYLSVFTLLTFTLNPLFWSNPIRAIQASWNARNELLGRQTEITSLLAPEQLLLTPEKRAAVLITNLFFVPPSFAEVGNYRDETSTSETLYLSILGNNLGRGIIAGGILLFLALTGFLLALLDAFKSETQLTRFLLILMSATVFQFVALLIAVPLPWQRYVIPLIPFVCLWSAFGISALLEFPNKILETTHRP